MTRELNIAIVDDDEAVRSALASLVRSVGYGVRTYGSGADFLNDVFDKEPVCMISDIQMPVMTGEELQARLVSAGRLFPIIFLTAFPMDVMKQRVLDAGAHCVLTKPADGETVIRCIESATLEV